MANNRKPLHPDYLFNIFKLNKYFAISSILLLIVTLLMIRDDYSREWKAWQRKFRTLEIEKTNREVAGAEEELKNNADYQTAKAAFDEAAKRHQKSEVELFKLQKKNEELNGHRYRVNAQYLEEKSVMDSLAYDLEEARHRKEPKAVKIQKNYELVKMQVLRAKTELDQMDAELGNLRKQTDSLNQEKQDAEDKKKKFEAQLVRLERKQTKIERSFVNDILRDAPMLDFIDPSLKVKEIIVPDIRADYNFVKIPRVDSCTTCHMAIDKPGYEDQPNPLKTHPRLDLYLASNSKHPMGDFGCTTCHLGQGGALTFTKAVHSPQNDEQAKTWEKKYHWHRVHQWEEPMLPLQYTQATCVGCHGKDWEIPGGERIQKGMWLVERSGCYGCHKIEGWQSVRKAGPSLARVSSKVTPDFMFKWIRNPRAFRPTTNMPQLFDQSNTSDPKSKARSTAEIWSIVKYLQSKSEPYSPVYTNSLHGDVERGKKLFGTVGCLGCHQIDDFKKGNKPETIGYLDVERGFGPNLSEVGSKISQGWLSAWLKNPKDYWHDTRMPSLRLSDAEIADLTAYLMTKRNPAFEQMRVDMPDRSVLNDTVFDFLHRKMSDAEAREKLRSMSEDEKALFLGEKTIAHYGCFGCHLIPGFEEAKPIGTELTQEASKPISRFDFAYVPIEHTVDAWVHQKLKEPRIYDAGRMREPLDKLKMPNFQFTEDEADAITTFIMGLRKYQILATKMPKETPARLAVRAGRRVLRDNNCRGCHIIEGVGGVILSYYEDPSFGPPNIASQGARVQQDWLYKFFEQPSTIRPWLNVRMPSFGFDSDHRIELLRYFQGLEGLDIKIEETPKIVMTAERLKLGRDTFNQSQCTSCHKSPPYPAGTDLTNLAPSFRLTPNRIRYDWIEAWLKDPQKMIPGTRMPNLFYSDGQPLYPDAAEKISALRDYLYTQNVYGK